MATAYQRIVHIPPGIRFGCSGCGNCCHMWPVPLTAEDSKRLQDVIVSESFGFQESPSLRAFNSQDERHAAFTHTLEKRADGKCQFLTEGNRCRLHEAAGAQAKPSMCQLFPYTFTQTPGGVYSSLSFASTGVLYNSGDLLSEQRQTIEDMWLLYSRLFGEIRPDWDNLQLIDAVPLKWTAFAELENEMLRIVETPAEVGAGSLPVEQRLLRCSAHLIKHLPGGVTAERTPPLEARPKIIDQLLLQALNVLYLPDDVFASNQTAFNARQLLESIVAAPDMVTIAHAGKERRFQDAFGQQLTDVSPEVEALLHRFVYCRLFSKQYFGPTMGYLSLLAGLHHLLVLMVLLKVRLKLQLAAGEAVTFDYAAELLRTAERRLTQLSFPRESAAVLEVMLTSPSRVERLVGLLR